MTAPWTTNVDSVHEATQADALREELVNKLIAQRAELNAVLSSEVEAAFRTVPQHLFVPGVPVQTAYANDTVVTKRDERGIALRSVSAPWLQAMMLEQAQLAPGMRVLEIGSGGYNAALITELAGEEGEITTVDIDPDVVERARHCLAAAGYRRVNVVLADAEGGVAAGGAAPPRRFRRPVGPFCRPGVSGSAVHDGGAGRVPLGTGRGGGAGAVLTRAE